MKNSYLVPLVTCNEDAKRYFDTLFGGADSAGLVVHPEVTDKMVALIEKASEEGALFPALRRTVGVETIHRLQTHLRYRWGEGVADWFFPIFVAGTMRLKASPDYAITTSPTTAVEDVENSYGGVVATYDSALVGCLIDARVEAERARFKEHGISSDVYSLQRGSATGIFSFEEVCKPEGHKFSQLIRFFKQLATNGRAVRLGVSGLRGDELCLNFAQVSPTGETLLSGMAIFYPQEAVWSVHT